MKKYLIGFILIFISLVGIINIFFSSQTPAKLVILKHNIAKGGVLYNNTSIPVSISCDSYIGTIPAQKNSIEIGLKDVDALIINTPMMFHNNLVNNKVLKFCDFGIIEVEEKPKGNIIIKTKGRTWMCKLVNDFNLYDSVKEAFGQI